MKGHHRGSLGGTPVGVNPGYAAFQMAKALTTSQLSEDAATRERLAMPDLP